MDSLYKGYREKYNNKLRNVGFNIVTVRSDNLPRKMYKDPAFLRVMALASMPTESHHFYLRRLLTSVSEMLNCYLFQVPRTVHSRELGVHTAHFVLYAKQLRILGKKTISNYDPNL